MASVSRVARRLVRWPSVLLLLVAVATITSDASAADFSDYATESTFALTLPPRKTGYFTLFGTFGATTTQVIDGYALKGRLYAVDGDTIWLQKNYGASAWVKIATVSTGMDPSFLKISPDGTKFALGTGFGKPLFIASSSIFSVASPPNLATVAGVKRFPASFFDAAWRDERWLFVDDVGDVGSRIYAIDTTLDHPESGFVSVIPDIPGASSGCAFDEDGNFVTGIGLTYDGARALTGQVRVWSAVDIARPLTTGGDPLAYLTTGHVVADAILSAWPLGFDADGNLYVGGGDAFGGTHDIGYAGFVNASVVTRALAGGAPVDEGNAAEYTILAPDPCKNDDSTFATYVASLKMVVVTANLQSMPPTCATTDNGASPSTAQMQLYFPPSAPDSDGDGVPDGADNAYLTPNPDQTDTDGDGFGDVADVDLDDDGVVTDEDYSIFLDAFGATKGDANYAIGADFDHDGTIDFVDFAVFEARWGKSAPFY